MKQVTTLKKVKDAVVGIADSVGKSRIGSIMVRRGYFYRHGMDSDKFEQAVTAALDKVGIKYTVKNSGDHWAPFRGGASVAQSSHFYVELNIIEEENN